ncbi:MAG: hypothetical protein HY814_11985 [Candidatus Riflebacteria bacterium]|nr:hypothetical protein [Candidatus Riflebacteria bacterium]
MLAHPSLRVGGKLRTPLEQGAILLALLPARAGSEEVPARCWVYPTAGLLDPPSPGPWQDTVFLRPPGWLAGGRWLVQLGVLDLARLPAPEPVAALASRRAHRRRGPVEVHHPVIDTRKVPWEEIHAAYRQSLRDCVPYASTTVSVSDWRALAASDVWLPGFDGGRRLDVGTFTVP